jgi:hypothetical protein
MRSSPLTFALCLGFSLFQVTSAEFGEKSLAGRWRFELDRNDVGVTERWFSRKLTGSITLPGSLPGQGIGDAVTIDTKWIGGIVDKSWFTAPEFENYRKPGNVKVPFWLQPERYYAGAAWFQREIEIPDRDSRTILFLERPHWETRVWVDDIPYGTNNALGTPHEYDLGILPAGKHTLTVRVDNRMVVDVGENSHSVSDHTQGNWNGIVGRIDLQATPHSRIDDLQVFPDLKEKKLRVEGVLEGSVGFKGRPAGFIFEMEDVSTRQKVRLEKSPGDYLIQWSSRSSLKTNPSTEMPDNFSSFQAELPLRTATNLWDEFSPRLYRLTAALATDDGHVYATKSVTYGLREISTQGTQFTFNGRKTFFRGTLECCIFPKTGNPPTEVSDWKRIIRVAKAHGLNMLRFHSWCPPEAAFVAADELGFYLQVECSSWANQSTTIGDGKPIDRWIYEEADRILKFYGNHPSFVLMPYGNEPGGPKHAEFLAKWVQHYRAADSRRLYTAAAGWPQIPENQFQLTPDPRIQGWGQGLASRINGKPPETVTDYRDYVSQRSVPVISHEIGQWCVYPSFEEMKKYTGYLKARNFEIFRDRLEANGMGSLAREFLLASGKLQALCYKEDIESALRTPGMGGFQLLDLHDFPGQGTALVGVLDPFWEEKGYITPGEFRRFCDSTVPLALLKQRAFTTQDRLTAQIEIAHYGPAPLPQGTVEWKLLQGKRSVVAKGEIPVPAVAVGSVGSVGSLDVDLAKVKGPTQCKLVLRIKGSTFENDWDLWVYPAAPAKGGADILVTAQFDAAARGRLREGGKVLLSIPGKQVRNYEKDPVKLGFSSIFWNTAWTGRQAPTTLGILCDPKHPALSEFPTDSHSNWQWWYLVHRAGALRLDLLPRETKPVVRIIDDWVTARPLGLVVEGKVGKGKIVICGFDLTRNSDDPVSRQMHASLVRYLGSKKCRPEVNFTEGQVQALMEEGGTGK